MTTTSASPPTPTEFLAFLQQIVGGMLSVPAWNRCVVTRYQQPELEAARKQLVQAALFCGQCSAQPWSPELASLASELLSSLPPTPE